MKETRNFFLKLTVASLALGIVSRLSGIGAHWTMYAWYAAAILFFIWILYYPGIPLFRAYTFYKSRTSEGMRFLEGTGFALMLIALYRMMYVHVRPSGSFIADVTDFSHLMDFHYWMYAGLLLLIAGLIRPAADGIYSVWMKFADLLHLVVSKIILTLAFFIAVLPIGFLAWILRKKFLDTAFKSGTETYWIKRPPSAEKMEGYYRQF